MALDLSPVNGGAQHRLKVALTMAWRDIRRHKGRSALIVALIALPIFAMSFAATAGMSMQPTPAETVAMELGQTQGRLSELQSFNATTVQAVGGDIGFGSGMSSGEPDPGFVPTAAADAVPAGFTALPWQSTTVTTALGKAQIEVSATIADVLNPAFKGKYTLLDGAAPASANEALATRGLMERFGIKPGQEFTTSAGTFAITGTVRTENQGDGESYLFLKKEQLPDGLAEQLSPATVYLVGEKALRWTDAKALNAQGVMLTSRSLILDPPGTGELGPDYEVLASDWRDSGVVQLILMGGLIGVLALLEVGLLAGAAFAVGARKQQRDLALLAASGAESSMVRATVTASGLWLGLAGGVIGAVLGTVAAGIVVMVIRAQGSAMFPGLHLMWLPALGLIILGTAAGLVAAMVPARAVAKQATLSALKSGRTADAPGKWSTRIGFGLLALSAALMIASSTLTIALRGSEEQWRWAPWLAGLVIAGAVALVFAFIFLTGKLIEILTTRTAWLPVPLRLAARDSARNRGRTVPAVAAVLAAATMSGALMVGTASAMQDSSDNHQWSANLNQAAVPLEYVDYNYVTAGGGAMLGSSPELVTVDPAAAGKLLTEQLGPGTSTLMLRGVPGTSQCELDLQEWQNSGTENTKPPFCPRWVVAEPVENRCELAKDLKPKDLADWRCTGAMSTTNHSSGIPALVVGGDSELAALLGREPSAAARDTLSAGGMVLSNKVYLQSDGTAEVISYDPNDEENWGGYDPSSPDTQYMRQQFKALEAHRVPAVVDAPDKALPYFAVVSPAAAAKMELPVSDQTLLVTVPKVLSRAEQDQLQAAMAPLLGQYNHVQIERGPASNMTTILWLIVIGGALITLSAAGITAGLALADGRNDHATLASVGADTRLRKAISGSQTLMTAMLGTLLGVVAGAIPTIVVLSQSRGSAIVIPWLQLGALAVLVPLFGAGAAWVLTRGRLPMTRRQTLA